MLTSITTLLLLGCIAVLQAQDASVDIEIDINLENIPDPCAKHECQAGERCESVITPQLLGLLPVAHCIPLDNVDKQGPCKDNQITANILSCKTEREWNNIGSNQCRLRNSGVLTKSKPMYNCPRQRTLQPEYMMFKFTCCSEKQTPSPEPSAKPPPPSKDSSQGSPYNSHDTGLLNAASPDSPEEPSNEQPNMIYLIPITLGAVVLLSLIALILGVWQRYRTTRHHRKPKLVFATSFVNLSAEHQPPEQDWAVNPLDTTDKSLLIVNEHPRK